MSDITVQSTDEQITPSEPPDPSPSFMVFDDERGNTAVILCIHASPNPKAVVRITVSGRDAIIDLEVSDHDAGVIIDALQEWRRG